MFATLLFAKLSSILASRLKNCVNGQRKENEETDCQKQKQFTSKLPRPGSKLCSIQFQCVDQPRNVSHLE